MYVGMHVSFNVKEMSQLVHTYIIHNIQFSSLRQTNLVLTLTYSIQNSCIYR